MHYAQLACMINVIFTVSKVNDVSLFDSVKKSISKMCIARAYCIVERISLYVARQAICRRHLSDTFCLHPIVNIHTVTTMNTRVDMNNALRHWL